MLLQQLAAAAKGQAAGVLAVLQPQLLHVAGWSNCYYAVAPRVTTCTLGLLQTGCCCGIDGHALLDDKCRVLGGRAGRERCVIAAETASVGEWCAVLARLVTVVCWLCMHGCGFLCRQAGNSLVGDAAGTLGFADACTAPYDMLISALLSATIICAWWSWCVHAECCTLVSPGSVVLLTCGTCA